MAVTDIPASFIDGVVTVTDDNGNSATLDLAAGDLSASGFMPDGKEAQITQSRGAFCGIRKGQRVFPSLSVSAKLATPATDFWKLVHGLTSGFTSVMADLGDYPGFDFDFSFDYLADTRDIVAQDCVCTDWSLDESASTVSFAIQMLGPVTVDSETLISAR